MRISATSSFLRQANKLFKKNPDVRKRFELAINKMLSDPHDSSLKTHKLKGDLKEFWSCSITYEIRLRFKIADDTIELIDMGTHDEVY
jgi:addiction module RelE/StbE family toxin